MSTLTTANKNKKNRNSVKNDSSSAHEMPASGELAGQEVTATVNGADSTDTLPPTDQTDTTPPENPGMTPEQQREETKKVLFSTYDTFVAAREAKQAELAELEKQVSGAAKAIHDTLGTRKFRHHGEVVMARKVRGDAYSLVKYEEPSQIEETGTGKF